MRLTDLKFDRVRPGMENAMALAKVWYPELSGSAESRIEQIAARRALAQVIYELMQGPEERRTMAIVRLVVSERAAGVPAEFGRGYASAALNVSDSRSLRAFRGWCASCARCPD